MAITLKATGAWARMVTDGGTVALAGGSPAAGDRMFMFGVWKTFSITVADPAGWTRIHEFADGTTASGVGSGSMKVAAWYRDWVTGDTDPVIDYSTAPTEGFWVIQLWQKASTEFWDTPQFVTAGIAAADPWSATSSSTIRIKNNGVVFELVGLSDDSATIARDTNTALDDDGSPAVTWNGNIVESPATHISSTTGQDASADLIHRLVTTGAEGVNLTTTGDPAAAETGACLWVYQGAHNGEFYAPVTEELNRVESTPKVKAALLASIVAGACFFVPTVAAAVLPQAEPPQQSAYRVSAARYQFPGRMEPVFVPPPVPPPLAEPATSASYAIGDAAYQFPTLMEPVFVPAGVEESEPAIQPISPQNYRVAAGRYQFPGIMAPVMVPAAGPPETVTVDKWYQSLQQPIVKPTIDPSIHIQRTPLFVDLELPDVFRPLAEPVRTVNPGQNRGLTVFNPLPIAEPYTAAIIEPVQQSYRVRGGQWQFPSVMAPVLPIAAVVETVNLDKWEPRVTQPRLQVKPLLQHGLQVSSPFPIPVKHYIDRWEPRITQPWPVDKPLLQTGLQVIHPLPLPTLLIPNMETWEPRLSQPRLQRKPLLQQGLQVSSPLPIPVKLYIDRWEPRISQPRLQRKPLLQTGLTVIHPVPLIVVPKLDTWEPRIAQPRIDRKPLLQLGQTVSSLAKIVPHIDKWEPRIVYPKYRAKALFQVGLTVISPTALNLPEPTQLDKWYQPLAEPRRDHKRWQWLYPFVDDDHQLFVLPEGLRPPDTPGLQYTAKTNRLHYVSPANRLHYKVNDDNG